jgi:hypothetical protein
MARKGLCVAGLRWGWGVALAVVVFGAPPGHATVRELLMEEAGLNPLVLGDTPAIRLQGMGGLDLSVADERNEINAYDFGGSIGGLLDDGERWTAETWLGNHDQTAENPSFSAERRFGHSGLQIVRRWPDRALGADVNYTYFEDTDSRLGWTKVRGPLLSAIVNQRIGPVATGLIVGREAENESRISNEFFTVHHHQDRWVGQFGANVPLGGVMWGAAWSFERGDVIGKGVDPARYHEDTFTWRRPVDRYTLFGIFAPRPWLEGGLRYRTLDRQGSETDRVSWSAESPLNPSGTNYVTEAISFFEEESDWDVTTRWRLHGASESLLGVEARYRGWSHRVEEGREFKGTLRAGFAERKILSVGLGASRRILGSRLLVALEGRAEMENWTDEDQNRLRTEGKARVYTAGSGIEFFASDRLMLRAGVGLFSDDRNTDEPLSLRTGQRIGGGISWVPRGGLVQIQGAVEYRHGAPKDAQATALEESTESQYTVGLRWLL